jgi:hypothetical protein
VEKIPRDRYVAVIHGRNIFARDGVFEFLRSLDLHPIQWEEAVEATEKAAPFIGEVLEALFNLAQAVIVLLTPDEDVILKPRFRKNEPNTICLGQARPNVIFEAGLAMAFQPTRTILLRMGNHRDLSDISGRHEVHFSEVITTKERNSLKNRLKTAGCSVDDSGSDWTSAGEENLKLALSVANAPSIASVLRVCMTVQHSYQSMRDTTIAALIDVIREIADTKPIQFDLVNKCIKAWEGCDAQFTKMVAQEPLAGHKNEWQRFLNGAWTGVGSDGNASVLVFKCDEALKDVSLAVQEYSQFHKQFRATINRIQALSPEECRELARSVFELRSKAQTVALRGDILIRLLADLSLGG